MGQVIDEADYRRRLEALDTSDISIGAEVSDIGAGWSGLVNPLVTDPSKIGSGPLNARKDVLDAKQIALRQARKEMINAIIRAEQDQAFNGVLPTEVEQIVTGKSDDLIKV
jgi:hypothetical protein